MHHATEPSTAALPVLLRALAPLLLCTSVATLHLVYALASVAVPYVFGDEAGYLLKAAALDGVRTDAYSSYYPGYSLLIAPAFWLASDPAAVFRVVQVLNALLWGVAAWAMLALGRRLAPEARARELYGAAALVSLYPAFLAFSCFALSENALTPLVLLLALLMLRLIERPTSARALLLGAGTGLLLLTNPRAAAVGVALLAALLPWAWRTRRWVPYLRVAAAAAVGFASLHLASRAFFLHELHLSGGAVRGHYPGMRALTGQLLALAAPAEAAKVATAAAGQAAYLIAGSVGLAAVGAVCLLRWLRHADEARRMFARFALASLALTLLMTAFFMRGDARIDLLFYGRYSEDVIALVLLPGALLGAGRRVWYGAALLLFAFGAVLIAVYGATARGWTVEINVIGLELYRWLGAPTVGVSGIGIAAIAVSGAILLGMLGRLAGTAALRPLLGTTFAVGAFAASCGYLRPESDFHAPQHSIARAIKAVPLTGRCVLYDLGAADYWGRYNYQYFLLPLRMRAVTLSGPRAAADLPRRCAGPQGQWIISSNANLDRRLPEAQLVMREQASEQRLWWLPRPG
ncbi:MAG TPA: hypothetical protein VF216_09685 [Mizugakiibacter sp.]